VNKSSASYGNTLIYRVHESQLLDRVARLVSLMNNLNAIFLHRLKPPKLASSPEVCRLLFSTDFSSLSMRAIYFLDLITL
jgi:hypothetical protein